MGVTIFILYKEGKLKKKEGGLYFLGLIINSLWSPIFFGWHLKWVGLVTIGLLWLVIAFFIYLNRKKILIVLLNSAYLLWLSIAFSLNLSIALNNGPIKNPEAYLEERFELEMTGEAREAFKKLSSFSATQKTSDGYHRLKSEDLFLWNQIRLKMANANSDFCATLWLGDGKVPLEKGLQGLEREDLNAWAKLSSKAFEAAWKVEPTGAYPEAEVSKSIFNMSMGLKEKERHKFYDSLKTMESLNREDACWMFKLMMGWIDQNRNLEGEKLLYFFAQKLSK